MVTRMQELPLFARRMKTARERLDISQMELGVRAGIDEFSSSARINQYERGKHTPDFLTAEHLAKVLCVPAAYFYAEDDNLAELIALFGQLKTIERKELLGFAESLVGNAKLGKGK
jgi:transcriptional regulator with XRE-family HTH domain